MSGFLTQTHVQGVLGDAVLLGDHLQDGLHHVRDDDGLHAGDAGEGLQVHLADAPGADDPCEATSKREKK